MPDARLRGIDIHYEHGGDGPRLLFCNGSGSSLADAAALLDLLRPRFELLAHDQRGLGRTSVPDEVPTMADYAADALELVDHVGWSTFGLFGMSFGGMVAQEVAVTAPERIERLALWCTSPGGGGGSSYPLHELRPEDATPQLIDTRFTAEWLADHPSDAAIAQGFSSRRGAKVPPGAALQLEARRHHDTWDRLDRITCPTLVGAGRSDGIAPAANSEAIASRIPNADLRLYEGGHSFAMQDRAAIPDLLSFFAS